MCRGFFFVLFCGDLCLCFLVRACDFVKAGGSCVCRRNCVGACGVILHPPKEKKWVDDCFSSVTDVVAAAAD